MASRKLTAATEFGNVQFAAPELIISKLTEKILWTDQYKDHTRIWAMALPEVENMNHNHILPEDDTGKTTSFEHEASVWKSTEEAGVYIRPSAYHHLHNKFQQQPAVLARRLHPHCTDRTVSYKTR